MKAQVLEAFGSVENFQMRQLPDPVAGRGEVVVRVKATSVNPVDYKIRSHGPGIAPTLPAVLGMDMAGIVEAVGEGVTAFAVGDDVYGCVGGVKGVKGTNAELVAADAALVAPKPRSLDFLAAAALPLVTITAWEGLDRARISAGDHLLIHGGAGGVGHVAIQLAKARGARVAATVSSAEKALAARELGADDVVNYRDESVEAYVDRLTAGKGFDVVFDCTGGSNLGASFAGARLNGQVVTIVSQYEANLSLMHVKGLSLHVVFMLIPMLHRVGRAEHGRILCEAAALAEAGSLRPLIDPRRFTLETLPSAHEHLESGAAVGKVVVGIA